EVPSPPCTAVSGTGNATNKGGHCIQLEVDCIAVSGTGNATNEGPGICGAFDTFGCIAVSGTGNATNQGSGCGGHLFRAYPPAPGVQCIAISGTGNATNDSPDCQANRDGYYAPYGGLAECIAVSALGTPSNPGCAPWAPPQRPVCRAGGAKPQTGAARSQPRRDDDVILNRRRFCDRPVDWHLDCRAPLAFSYAAPSALSSAVTSSSGRKGFSRRQTALMREATSSASMLAVKTTMGSRRQRGSLRISPTTAAMSRPGMRTSWRITSGASRATLARIASAKPHVATS